ncbi:MAG: hypothetical protein FWB78_00465 [Treponema sp.]|nr:hypothetical protein [Treponema sp.]
MKKISIALFVAMLILVQPVFAQDSVIILDLGYATDDELADALGAATELELIMRAEWYPLYEDEAAVAEAEYAAEEPVVAVEAEEAAEDVAIAAEVEEAEEDVVIAAEVEEVAEEVVVAVEAEEAAEDVVIAAEAEEAAEDVAIVAEAEEATEDVVIMAEVEEAAEDIAVAAEDGEVTEDVAIVAEAEEPVPATLDNRYFQESQRLVRLAEEAYERGDYEAAAIYAQEASRYAQLSDEYIAGYAADEEPIVVAEEGYPLPATFTVRPWATYRDCLWNIAAHPDIYGDPLKWPVLFNANRHRMPNPNNPDLILPGMVLEIPSIDGEFREGAWQSGRVYRRR